MSNGGIYLGPGGQELYGNGREVNPISLETPVKTKKAKPTHGDLRVWWIPQIPGRSFHVPCGNTHNPDSYRIARILLDTLARYDQFQLDHNIKPDYSNAGGLQVYCTNKEIDGCPDWIDWLDSQDGETIDDTETPLSELKWELDHE